MSAECALAREEETLASWTASFVPSLLLGAAAGGLALAWSVPLGGAAVLGVLVFGWARIAWVGLA